MPISLPHPTLLPLVSALCAGLLLAHPQARADEAARSELDRVLVTATRSSKALDKLPGAVQLISREDIEAQLLLADDLGALLASQVPGYAPSRQKLTSFGESLRGRAALILFDGVPQTNPLRAGAREGYFADPALIERIEVVSGASAVQGLGATGGIINYISRRPRQAGTQQQLELRYGGQGHGDDAGWKAGWRLEHLGGSLDALVYLGAAQRGVGVDGQGRRLGMETTQGDLQDSRALDGFVKLGYALTPQQRLQFSLNRYQIEGEGDWRAVDGDRASGRPTSAQPGTPPGRPARNAVRTATLEWSHADLAGGQASAQLYSQDFSALYGAGLFPTFKLRRADGVLVDQLDQSEIVADKSGLRLGWVRPELMLEELELTLGLDALRDDSQQRLALTGRTWVPPLQFRSLAPFAQLEYEFGSWTLRGGARRESARLRVDDYRSLDYYGARAVQGGERRFDQSVWNLGGVWRWGGGWSVFAAYNEGFGLPDVGLVLRGVNRDNQSFERLIDLQPVLTDNRELGLSWRGRQGSFSASVFDSRSELGSQVRVDSATGIGTLQRLPVEVKGFEFSGEWRPRRDWQLSASYARTRGKTAAASGLPLDLDLGARSQGPDKLVVAARWTPWSGASARLQATQLASRHVNAGRRLGSTQLEERFQGYTLVDASWSWSSRWGDWGVGVENLFDRQYIGYYAQSNPAGTPTDYFAGRGRSFSLSWKRSF